MKYRITAECILGGKRCFPGDVVDLAGDRVGAAVAAGVIDSRPVEFKPESLPLAEKPESVQATVTVDGRDVPDETRKFYTAMTVRELREELKSRSLSTFGSKADLIKRLGGD